MATTIIDIPINTWTLIAEADCNFQVLTQYDIKVTESTTPPTDPDAPHKIARSQRRYDYLQTDGDLYAYAGDAPARIGIDL